MSGRFFQSVIVQMKEATDRTIGVIDPDGSVIACNELAMVGSRLSDISSLASDGGDTVSVCAGKTFRLLGSAGARFDYAVFVDGEDENARCICVLAAIAFNEAKEYYEESTTNRLL